MTLEQAIPKIELKTQQEIIMIERLGLDSFKYRVNGDFFDHEINFQQVELQQDFSHSPEY